MSLNLGLAGIEKYVNSSLSNLRLITKKTTVIKGMKKEGKKRACEHAKIAKKEFGWATTCLLIAIKANRKKLQEHKRAQTVLQSKTSVHANIFTRTLVAHSGQKTVNGLVKNDLQNERKLRLLVKKVNRMKNELNRLFDSFDSNLKLKKDGHFHSIKEYRDTHPYLFEIWDTRVLWIQKKAQLQRELKQIN